MDEHWIRLRGGWRLVGPADSAEPAPRWLRLPLTAWPEEARARSVILSRSFQAPPLRPGRERLWLRLEAVEGLQSVSWNSEPLEVPGWEAVACLALENLAPRNELRLVVDREAAAAALQGAGAWGQVALVIRSDALK